MTKYLLIGGRSNSFEGKSKIYESFNKYSKTNKLLYIPYANLNYEQGYKNFLSQAPSNLEVTLLSYDYLENIEKLETKFIENEIWFFAGGSANTLMNTIYDNKINEIIYKYKDDKVIAGISAGAIMISSFGFGDKDVFIENNNYYNFKMVHGLKLIPYVVCPHYQKNGIEIFDEEVKKYGLDGICLEDDTSLWILQNVFDIIKDTSKNSVYLIDKNENFKLIPLYERKE